MARGRKPQSPEEQAARGAPGKRMSGAQAQAIRTNSRARLDPVQIGNVRPPRWLKKSRKATEIWNDVLPQLLQLNLATQLDALALGRYCRYVAEWIAADLTVQKEGTWFEAVGTNGEPTKKRHPAWQACQDIEKMLRETEAAFGMRPDARYKIMRDQAISHGVLPLFGGEKRESAAEGIASPADATAKMPEEDALGILAGFDSPPPDRMN